MINDSFSAQFTQERDYCFLQIGGDTLYPDKLKDKIYDFVRHIHDYSISKDDFERLKKKTMGILISVFNSPEAIANMFSRYYFEGVMIFELIDCLNELTLDDLNQLKDLSNKYHRWVASWGVNNGLIYNISVHLLFYRKINHKNKDIL